MQIYSAGRFIPCQFPISRDPPEGGTARINSQLDGSPKKFPISRDPHEGGTLFLPEKGRPYASSFQFLGIPPKGERVTFSSWIEISSSFQFLGIPPKGERGASIDYHPGGAVFPISRDPPEGGTCCPAVVPRCLPGVSNF